ncbi:MAG TPA: DUF2807 domain-containing protein, partial [Sphingobacterium sp.]|nr:DUF2807 domain-containing protein [Sphingobacterium sp.]
MKKTIWIWCVFVLASVSPVQSQQIRPLAAFTELEVTDKINVKLVASDSNYLEINGNLADKFELVQQDNSLRFKMALGYQLQGVDVYITLYHSSLAHIVARKGAVVYNENNTLSRDSLSLSAHEGAKIALRVQADRLGVFSGTGATVQLLGKARSQYANIALGGFYYAKELLSDHATVVVHAGGRGEVHVAATAD